MTKSLIVYIDFNNKEYKAHLTIKYKPKAFLSHDFIVESLRIETVNDAETNSRVTLKDDLKKAIETAAYRVLKENTPF